MPVRSLSSAVFGWPGREAVLAAARQWARELIRQDGAVREVFCVGSAARGDWGVGSDLDVIVILADTDLSAADRYRRYCPDNLPVPADLWTYTRSEWEALGTNAPHLWRRLTRERLALA